MVEDLVALKTVRRYFYFVCPGRRSFDGDSLVPVMHQIDLFDSLDEYCHITIAQYYEAEVDFREPESLVMVNQPSRPLALPVAFQSFVSQI